MRVRPPKTLPPLLIALLVLAAAPDAHAAMKKIGPLAFKPLHSEILLERTPAKVGAPAGASSDWFAYAPVRLPRGATIDSVAFFATTAGGGRIQAYLGYFDVATDATDIRVIAAGQNSGDLSTPTLLGADFDPAADRKVRPGNVYMAWIVADPLTYLWELQISYTP